MLNDARRGRLAGGHESPVLMRRLALGALWHRVAPFQSAFNDKGLNSPFGARCFMTERFYLGEDGKMRALMHRMALGAL